MIDRILLFFAAMAERRPWMVIIVAAILTGISGTLAAFKLDMNANTDDLIAQDRPYMKTYRAFLSECGDREFIHAVVEAVDAEKAERAVDALTARLRLIRELPGVFAYIEPDEQMRTALHSMSEAELSSFVSARAALPELLSGRGAGSAIEAASLLLDRLTSAGAVMNNARKTELGGGALFLLHALAAGLDDAPLAKDLAEIAGKKRKRAYLTSDNGRLYFVNIMPVKDYGSLAVVERPLAAIRAAAATTMREHPGVEIGITGKPVLQADEMTTTNNDMMRASILGLVLTAIPFILVIGGLWRPLLAVFAFGMGIVWSFGFAVLTVGSLNLLSVVFVPILVGIGLDFGVHLVIRYLEERRREKAHRDAMRTALLTSGRGNVTGALTQCAAFYTAMLTDFQGLRELGFVAGSGLIICLLSITIVLPALLELHERRRLRRGQPLKLPNPGGFGSRFGKRLTARPGRVLLGVSLATLCVTPFLGRLRFEENLLELQAKGLESVAWEHRIIENSDDSVWFGGAIAETIDEAATIIEKAKSKASIGAAHSLLDAIARPTEARQKQVAILIEAARAESKFLGKAAPLDANKVQKTAAHVETLARLAASEAPEESKTMTQLATALRGLAKRLLDPATKERALLETEQTTHAVAVNLRLMLAGAAMAPEDALPAAVSAQFVTQSKKFLVMIHPKNDIWETEPLERFVADLRSLHPTATGTPITHLESIKDMQKGFLLVAVYSVLVVFALVWIDFRNLTDTFLAAVPLFAGLFWTAVAMGAFNVSFNLANFFAAPILIGICVDNGVHILHRYREGGPDRLTLSSTARAILLTSLNNVLGFGCMATATHRGLRSLGLVMGMGAFFCMVSSLVILPPLLAAMEKRRKPRTTPNA